MDLEPILREVATRPYYMDEGSRVDLFKDAINDPNAFTYEFSGNGLSKKTVGFSAHIDTVYRDLREFVSTKDAFHGTMDNAAGVALLLMMKEELKSKSFIPRNNLKLFFTREEEGIGSDYFFSAKNLKDYADVDLMVVIDVRPRVNQDSRNVLIENCYPESVLDIARSIAGDKASIRTDGLSPDEAMEYLKTMPVMSIGPIIDVVDREKVKGAFWHDPNIDSFVRKDSMLDCYHILKRIANKEI